MTMGPEQVTRLSANAERHLLAEELGQLGALKFAISQEAVSFCQGLNPAGEALDEIARASRMAQGLTGNSLRHCQRVLDSVIEFFDEDALDSLDPLLLGDIPRDFRSADDPAALVEGQATR
jgi:hypothetical protein